MKKALIFAVLLFASCGTTIKQMKTDCNLSADELLKRVAMVMVDENMNITMNDAKLGYLRAETLPDHSVWTGMDEVRYWTFQVVDGKVTASAKFTYTQKNAFGATTGGTEKYVDDGYPKDYTWYWSVRNALEKLCGNKLVFIEKESK